MAGLKCPHCENSDIENMEYTEYVMQSSSLNGIKDGWLSISTDWRTEFEESMKPRIFCKKCYKYFKIPESIKVEFV